MAQVVFVNTDNLGTTREESVEVHGPKCGHLTKLARSPFFEVNEPEEWNSAQAFFNDYNADFYDEAGNDGCWPIAFFPCSKLVNRTTTISEYK